MYTLIEDRSLRYNKCPQIRHLVQYLSTPPTHRFDILSTGIEGWIVFLSDFLVFHSLSKAPTLSVFYNKLKGELCLHDISVITVLHYHYVGWGIGQNPPKTKSTWQNPPETKSLRTKSPKHESGTKTPYNYYRGVLSQGVFDPGGFCPRGIFSLLG